MLTAPISAHMVGRAGYRTGAFAPIVFSSTNSTQRSSGPSATRRTATEPPPQTFYARSMPEHDLKPRSRDVTDGIEKAASRGMLRAVGMGDEDWDKPQIGIASSWNEITPCNLSLARLAQGAKEGVHSGGGYPLAIRHGLGVGRHRDGP